MTVGMVPSFNLECPLCRTVALRIPTAIGDLYQHQGDDRCPLGGTYYRIALEPSGAVSVELVTFQTSE